MRSRVKQRSKPSRNGADFKNQIERVITAFVDRAAVPPRRSRAVEMTLQEATKRFQLKFVRDALDRYRVNGRWNISAAARALAVSRTLLYRLVEDMPGADRFKKRIQRRRGKDAQ